MKITLFNGYEYVQFLTAIRPWLLELPILPTPQDVIKNRHVALIHVTIEINAQNFQVTS